MAIGLSDPHVMPSLSTHGSPIHSNIDEYIAYKISKRRLLQQWDDQNLIHTADWDKINPTLFKRAWETTTVHMAQIITKYTSNTQPTMSILQRQGHATNNLCLRCGVTPETIQHR